MGCNCTCGRKELVLLYFQSYHHELNNIFHSIIAIASLPFWKLSMLGHMNFLYMHIYISIYILINFSICEAYPKRLWNNRSNKAFAIRFCGWGNEVAMKWNDLLKVALRARYSELCFLISLIFINMVSVFTVFSSFMSFYRKKQVTQDGQR